MVLPVWKDTDKELPQPMTRMTLHLHEKGDQAGLQNLRHTIFKQLDDLQQTCLLFLRNLKKIHVSFYGEDGELQNSREFRVGDLDNHRRFLETSSTNRDGEVTVEKKHYHVTRNMAHHISRSDNREVSDTEEGTQAFSTTEVILAFPLTNDSNPITEKQQLFAFLPVRMLDFKFIIQADFDTSASRQDIITTSRRNESLLGAIADTFVKAILQFCEHDDLCYTWPRFLPLPDDGSSSSFWAGLMPKIKSRLSETPVLRSRRYSYLRLIRDVRFLADNAQDSDGNPIFEDASLDLYISKAYPWSSHSPLREEYGLEVGTMGLLLDALEVDLKSSTSKMKSESTSAEWHSKAAKLLADCYRREYKASIARLKTIPLVPLLSGQWVSSKNSKLYLPTTNGISIPPALDLPILSPTAVANEDRKTLFIDLGAAEPPVAIVRNSILISYSSSSTQSISVSDSKAHLHFLYLTHQPGHSAVSLLKDVKIYDSNGVFANPHITDFYLSSSHAYGPEALLQPTADAPGFPVTFVHPTYLEDRPSAPSSSHPTWSKWLQDTLGLRDRLRLVSPQGNSLSDTWHYVREHRPEKLLGLLGHLWKFEGSRIVGNQSLIDQIKETPADKLCRVPPSYYEDEDDALWTLQNTWLPLPHLQSQCSRYMLEDEYLPFLDLEGSDTMSPEQISAKWAFLHTTFSVGKDETITFLLAILSSICDSAMNSGELDRPERIVDLYIAIDAKCTAAVNRREARDVIR